MSKQTYTLSPMAAADLSEIWDYSAQQWGTTQADRYVLSIKSTCESLASRQLKGSPINEIRKGYSKQISGSHYLYFQVKPNGTVNIIRILHQRMDVSAHL